MCISCGSLGRVKSKFIRSYYYPEHDTCAISPYCPLPSNHRVKGTKYLSELDCPKGKDRKDAIGVKGPWQCYDYVSHYDKSKYQQQKIEYEAGLRKSKPNGHRWCHYDRKKAVSFRFISKTVFKFAYDFAYDHRVMSFENVNLICVGIICMIVSACARALQRLRLQEK